MIGNAAITGASSSRSSKSCGLLRESLPDADIVAARIKDGALEIDFRGTMGREIRVDVKIGGVE